jgi:hypothetical protein
MGVNTAATGAYGAYAGIYDRAGQSRLLTTADLVATLGGVAGYLRPGGLFLFDLNMERKLAEWGSSLERWISGGTDHLWSTRYNRRQKLVTVSVTAYVPAGRGGLYRRVAETFRTVRRLLAGAGLETAGIYRCLSFKPAVPEDYRVAVLARKPLLLPARVKVARGARLR